MKREHIFGGIIVDYTGGLDEAGIPFIAYDNTEGDTPVSCRQLINKYAYLVTFVQDEAL